MKFDTRATLIIILLSLCACLIFLSQSTNTKIYPSLDLEKIPSAINTWIAKEIPVEKRIKDILQTPSVIIKKYTNPEGESIFLTIVYYQANRVEFHSPERCSVGQGSFIAEADSVEIFDRKGDKFTNANKLLVKSAKKSEIIVYYFESGNFVTNSYFKLKLHMFMNKLKKQSNNGALVKFSSPVTNEPKVTLETVKQFISEVGPLLCQYLL